MIEQPVLETLCLRLRPLERSDTSAIQKTADTREIADTMISLPHPYPADEAERQFARHQATEQSSQKASCEAS